MTQIGHQMVSFKSIREKFFPPSEYAATMDVEDLKDCLRSLDQYKDCLHDELMEIERHKRAVKIELTKRTLSV